MTLKGKAGENESLEARVAYRTLQLDDLRQPARYDPSASESDGCVGGTNRDACLNATAKVEHLRRFGGGNLSWIAAQMAIVNHAGARNDSHGVSTGDGGDRGVQLNEPIDCEGRLPSRYRL